MSWKKNWRILLLSIGLTAFVGTTAQAASDVIKATVFRGQVFLNNQLVVQWPGEASLLHVGGTVYVPLRKFSEMTGAVVGYEAANRSVHIERPDYSYVRSEIHNIEKNEQFTLRISSEKATYTEGEPVRIWARLTNDNPHDVTVTHGEPLIGFSITDEDGYMVGTMYAYVANTSTFRPGDEMLAELSPMHYVFYNAMKHGYIEDFRQYEQETPRPAQLAPGRYTIAAEARYSQGAFEGKYTPQVLEAPIAITIEEQ